MSSPLVSIILPVYNRETLVARAIESALAQTYPYCELLVVDDGSTDGTRGVVERYAGRITLLTQDNKGPYPARNLALTRARGELIAFLDSDDVWRPQKLERQLPLFRRPEIALVFGDAIIVDYDGDRRISRRPRTYHQVWPPSRGRVFEALLEYDFIPQSSVVARRACFERLGPFSVKGDRSSDYAKWVQIAMSYEMDYLKEPVFELAIHGSNWSRSAEARTKAQRALFEELFAQAQDPRQKTALRRFLFNLECRASLSKGLHSPPAATLPWTSRLLWLGQFLYAETRTFLRLLTQMLYRRWG